jgi:galactose mutarotase-like enzyme
MKTYELHDTGARASIVPERGAIVTRWSLDGRELIYLDEATLLDPKANVRGGVPVLFPSPGKLKDDRFAKGAMKQHGFGRTQPWRVVADSTSRITLALSDDATTRAQFPFGFAVEMDVSLAGATLRFDLRVTNTGTDPLPFGFGLHPYFAVPTALKSTARIPTKATRAFDNVTKKTIDLGAIDLASGEVDLHLIDHGANDASLNWQGGGVHLRASPELQRWVIWTLPGRDFVCLEPWTCPADALNTGEGLLTLAPGDTRALFVAFDALDVV